MRLQIAGNAVSANVGFREAGSILNLVKENPADRAMGTFELQPLIIRTLFALDGRLDPSRFFEQILTRDVHRVTELNEKAPLGEIGEIRPPVAFLEFDNCTTAARLAPNFNGTRVCTGRK